MECPTTTVIVRGEAVRIVVNSPRTSSRIQRVNFVTSLVAPCGAGVLPLQGSSRRRKPRRSSPQQRAMWMAGARSRTTDAGLFAGRLGAGEPLCRQVHDLAGAEDGDPDRVA